MNDITHRVRHINALIDAIEGVEFFGKVSAIKGLIVEIKGLNDFLSIGSRCLISKINDEMIEGEVVGFTEDKALLMPFGKLYNIGVGCKVKLKANNSDIYPCESWKGRIINALAQPVDEKGPLANGDLRYQIKTSPIPASHRKRVENKIDLGVKSINSFLSCCLGQRMGIFAGSGVGKSVLISMLGRYAKTKVKIVGLIGERGRELYEFIHEYLGEEGLKDCVIIVATGDEPAIVRKQAAYLTMAVSEYFRDLGYDVLCIIDSLTRFAMAQREIGLSAGEPPSTKGYTPSVFSELPELLERAGPGRIGSTGSITGLFTVLVEGDDFNEPISDAVRGILDGHIILDRSIAERGIFPAVNILKSISRTMPGCNSEKENKLVQEARKIIANYNDMAEMIRLGAYKKGSDPLIDKAIIYYPRIEEFLKQAPKEESSLESAYTRLAEILGLPW